MVSDTRGPRIRDIVAAVHKGLHDRDAAAVTAHYAPDAMIFDLAPPLSHRWTWRVSPPGSASGRGLSRAGGELRATVSGDLAVWHGCYTHSATTLGGERRAWWERATLVFSQKQRRLEDRP